MNDGSHIPDAHKRDERLQALSSLMDGAGAPGDAARACTAWREAPEVRAAWHVYHVIGDVLRSDELGHGARRDAGFLHELRERLSAEPVLVAPQAEPVQPLERTVANGAQARRRSWMAPAAVAAGFVAVAGALVVTRMAAPPPAQRQMALAPEARPLAAVPVVMADGFVEPQRMVANGKLIRDVRLDQYLAAHKQFGGSSALGVPSGFLRSATYDAAER
jgi:sigma-E factor negative regulatory protein RseA